MRKLLLIIIALAACAIPAHAATCGSTTITGTIYYLATSTSSPAGNDSNNGTSASTPWLTVNHNSTAPAVICAAASTAYSYTQFQRVWGTCTSSSGDLCWVMCATFDSCKITSAGQNVFDMSANYWGVQGFEVTTGSSGGTCFNLQPQGSTSIHHIVFANNICNGSANNGFSAANKGGSTSVSWDYWAVIGNWAYNSAQGTSYCFSGISAYEPLASDTNLGTHIYIAGNLLNDNVDPNPCYGGAPSDGEGIILDSINYAQAGGPAYTQQIAVTNNIAIYNGNSGIEGGGSGNTAPTYIYNNTSYHNSTGNNEGITWCGDTSIDQASNTQYFGNLVSATPATSCGTGTNLADIQVSRSTAGVIIYKNWLNAVSGTNTIGNSNSGFTTFGPNNITGTNPAFVAPADPGAPSCGSATSAPNCFATVIANFVPTATGAKAYGYQTPSTTSIYDPLYPQWLCNVSNIPAGLVTPGCLIASHYQ